MCGIFGAVNIANLDYKHQDFMKAIEKVQHRGPDNLSSFYDDNCFLGHTRLSIVGVGEASNQPFVFENLILIFNGEVFNYVELASELRKHEYTIDTASDTEVVIKSFHCWGSECFKKFNGMWSMVIYDKNKKKWVISRDRFGQKPLFILRKGVNLFVASEFQQLVEFSNKEPNFVIISRFMKEGAFQHENQTFFKDIEIFPKASYAELELNGNLLVHQYWHYWAGPVKTVTDDCLKQFEKLLDDAIKIRIRCDVPFGILLSGGVDSSIIGAYMRKNTNNNVSISAYTYSSQDADDELQYAASISKKLGFHHVVKVQEKNPEDYLRRLEDIIRHLGRGHSSPAIVTSDQLLEAASKNGYKVVLDGQGADELLGGYVAYYPLIIFQSLFQGNFKRALLFFRAQIREGFFSISMLYLRNILPEKLKTLGRLWYGHDKFLNSPKDSNFSNYSQSCAITSRNPNALNRYLISQHNIGLENLIFYGDIIAMKNSIENRSPFMDHRLVDFSFSRTDKLKAWNGANKYILRTLPVYTQFKSELDRKKIGFSSDIKRKIKERMLVELQNSSILNWDIFTKNLKDTIKVGSIIDIDKFSPFFFRLYQVHLWNKIFVETTHSINPKSEF